MSLKLKRVLLALAVVGAAGSAFAFSLLGPYDAVYQTPALGYNPLGTDIGGPMTTGQGYRWNTTTVTYGFDQTFTSYFGAQGVAAVQQAIAILNGLPAASSMSASLTEYPLRTKRTNYRASALRLIDVKSVTLALLLEEMGLTSPERYVWTLRSRLVVNNNTRTNYTVIMRNFDPVSTSLRSKYVNGTLYTFTAGDIPLAGSFYSDAVESPVDPLAFSYTAVVSAADGLDGGGLNFGEFFTGLTRDDVGGLRYLYSAGLINTENLIPGTTNIDYSGANCPWCIPGATNVLATNAVVDLAKRPGVNKVTFVPGLYDSLLGVIITTNTDTYVTNLTFATQTVQRTAIVPDILFASGDIGLNTGGIPVAIARTGTTGWDNNAAVNSTVATAGPGVILPTVQITFSSMATFYFGFTTPEYLDQASAAVGYVWGSFDGTTNAPVVYGISLQELQQMVLSSF